MKTLLRTAIVVIASLFALPSYGGNKPPKAPKEEPKKPKCPADHTWDDGAQQCVPDEFKKGPR